MKINIRLKDGTMMSLGNVKYQKEYTYDDGHMGCSCTETKAARHVVDVEDVMTALFTHLMNNRDRQSWSISLDDVETAEVKLHVFDDCSECDEDGERHENCPWNNPWKNPIRTIPSFEDVWLKSC